MTHTAYSITPVKPAAHLFRVTCRVDSPDPGGQQFRLPNWIPGSYMIRDFSRHIVTIDARDERGDVALHKIDKSRWRAEPAQGELVVEYEVYAWDLSVRASHLDTTHGYFNGTSVFLLPGGRESSPCELTIVTPTDPACEDWRVATSMRAIAVDANGFGDYRADNYEDLVDHPVEMGTFERHVFTACGVEHQLVLSGRYSTDAARICADLGKICEHHIRFFGEPAPFDRYVFLVTVVGNGYGGLEHRFSTSLLVSRDSLPVKGESGIGDEYLEFLGLCSHEYFHAWNVKRIRPLRLARATLDREAHTSLLWAFEGITSYYDDLALVRCGLITPKRYLKLLSKIITRVAQAPGRKVQTIADSSFDAWTKFYKQDENAPNSIVSYYAKGTLVALALDLRMRESTGGEKCLDDLMRILWHRHGVGCGIDEPDIEATACEIAGTDLESFFELAVRGVDELPLASLLPQVGVGLKWRRSAAEVHGDSSDNAIGTTPLSQGMRLKFDAGLAQITHVTNASAAQRAGLSAGDTLLAIDSLRASEKSLPGILRRHCVGDTVAVSAFRRDELMAFEMVLSAAQNDTAELLIDDENHSLLAYWLSDEIA